jgi:phosphatidylserine/phosphatidylglycerophosphate/cardiolipin synthase-like enzyme
MEVETLTDGGQSAASIADRLASFLAQARARLDVAIYDFALGPETAAVVTPVFIHARRRGVAVRLAYNADDRRPDGVPPPPSTDHALIDSLGVPTIGVPGVPDLMHQKYVIRDRQAVWTGSTNWTDDSWTREENVIAVLDSAALAEAFGRDFDELWRTGRVVGSGDFVTDWMGIDGAEVRPWFSPGRGATIARRISTAMARAVRRVRVASPVITAGPILATLAEVASAHRVDLAGMVDNTQMNHVHGQWAADPHASWKIPAFTTLLADAPFSGKVTTPYGPGTVHDYMHAKVTVADDVVFVGSYNLSHSGTENAENVLEIRDPALADRLAAYVDGLRSRYPAARWPGSG